MTENESLRDATSDERFLAIRLSGQVQPRFIWVSETPQGGRIFIVCPNLGASGIAIGLDKEGKELWRKPAFYSELVRAGDGYQARYHELTLNVRGIWDGSWLPSAILPD